MRKPQKKSLTKYPIEFKIYPDLEKQQYYTVYFFKTKNSMYKFYLGATNKYPQKKKFKKLDFAAICQSFTVYDILNGFEILSNEIGSILFYKNKITTMIVSHEATHAALYYMEFLKRTKFTTNKDHDEELASAQGQLTRQIWVEYYNRRMDTN